MYSRSFSALEHLAFFLRENDGTRHSKYSPLSQSIWPDILDGRLFGVLVDLRVRRHDAHLPLLQSNVPLLI